MPTLPVETAPFPSAHALNGCARAHRRAGTGARPAHRADRLRLGRELLPSDPAGGGPGQGDRRDPGPVPVQPAHRVPMTFRAAGTSLSGQAVTDGILVEVARHWRDVRVEEGGRKVRVQPGVIGAHVNQALKAYRAKMGPDPASINTCTMGGILSNNSSGMCCGVTQNAYHTLRFPHLRAALRHGDRHRRTRGRRDLPRSASRAWPGAAGPQARARGDGAAPSGSGRSTG